MQIQVTAEGTDEVIHILNGASKATSLPPALASQSSLSHSSNLLDEAELMDEAD